MKKILNNYGGAILLYIVIFMGIVAISKEFNASPNKIEGLNQVIALNN